MSALDQTMAAIAPSWRWPLSVERYHQMIDAGILAEDDRVELLEGFLVAMSPQHPPHAFAVSMFQARAALMNAGFYDTVDAAMQQAGGVNIVAWEYATEVRRDSPLVQAMSQQLGLTEEQVDNLFRQAADITV